MWQAISHLLSEQLGEGEIELRNELPRRSMPHGIYVTPGAIFSLNVMSANCSPFYCRSRSA